ncbi:response regulator, partial [Pseudomonas sp. SIMBA_077]
MPDPVPAPLHVLVAEDEALAAMALEDFLSRKGFRVTLAQDGQEGLERYSADPADLVITDLRMPEESGISLIKRLREHTSRSHLPVIVMSGHAEMDDVSDMLRLQVLDLFRKPIY